jgi:hypothetical protein
MEARRQHRADRLHRLVAVAPRRRSCGSHLTRSSALSAAPRPAHEEKAARQVVRKSAGYSYFIEVTVERP